MPTVSCAQSVSEKGRSTVLIITWTVACRTCCGRRSARASPAGTRHNGPGLRGLAKRQRDPAKFGPGETLYPGNSQANGKCSISQGLPGFEVVGWGFVPFWVSFFGILARKCLSPRFVRDRARRSGGVIWFGEGSPKEGDRIIAWYKSEWELILSWVFTGQESRP